MQIATIGKFWSIAFLGALLLLSSGCTKWEYTRRCHKWGADRHNVNIIPTGGQRVSEDASITLWTLYDYQGNLYTKCNHEINYKKDLAAKIYAKYNMDKFKDSQLANTANPYAFIETATWKTYKTIHQWDFIPLADDEWEKIQASGGYFVWRFVDLVTEVKDAKERSYFRKRCYIADFQPGESATYTNLFPDKGHEIPRKTSYIFVETPAAGWYTQSKLRVAAKAPLYPFTVLADIVTGPFQSFNFRIGP